MSRLVAKASQLLGNFTTNIAEGWMHRLSKYEGGKVINRSQSGFRPRAGIPMQYPL